MFPVVRVEGTTVEPFLERIAAELADADDIPEGVLESGLAQIDREAWRRAVESWSVPYADRWHSLVEAAGAGNHGDDRVHHRLAPGVVLPPQLVWSIDEAMAAAVAQSGRRRSRARTDAVERVAYALMAFEHVVRTRRLCRRLDAELPVARFRAASEFLAGAVERVDRDLGAARAATAALLVAYVEELHHLDKVT